MTEKNKKATINRRSNNDKLFKYAIKDALNLEQNKSHPERISKIKFFINKCNFKELNFPSHKNDWKKFESDNKTIAVNILYVSYNNEQIKPEYIKKHPNA